MSSPLEDFNADKRGVDLLAVQTECQDILREYQMTAIQNLPKDKTVTVD